MKSVSRWVVSAIVAMAATNPVWAGSPLSNGLGDGEANVPFASAQERALEDDELGGGSGEHRPSAASAEDEAARAEGEREFERRVWTDP